MYMNPAFAGFDNNNNRVLILRRSQWSGINEYFNSNIIEFNASKTIRKRRISGGEIVWSGGFYLIDQTENQVFKSYDFGVVPFSFHFQFKNNLFLSMALQNVMSFNRLNNYDLTFSDQLDGYGNYFEQTGALLPTNRTDDRFFDASKHAWISINLTKHGRK